MSRSRDKEKSELIAQMIDPGRNPVTNSSDNKKMRRIRWPQIVIGGIVVIIIGLSIYYYNKFINLKQEVRDARAKIEASLQLRENMVPALGIALTDFITHENEVFIHATDARAESVGDKQQSDAGKTAESGRPVPAAEVDGLLSKLFAVAEMYPDLRTGEPFQLLMSKIADAEIQIFNNRIEYNTIVLNYNVKISTFPANIFAAIYRVRSSLYFEWKGEPEWVTTLDESKRSRTSEVLEKWRARVLDEQETTGGEK